MRSNVPLGYAPQQPGMYGAPPVQQPGSMGYNQQPTGGIQHPGAGPPMPPHPGKGMPPSSNYQNGQQVGYGQITNQMDNMSVSKPTQFAPPTSGQLQGQLPSQYMSQPGGPPMSHLGGPPISHQGGPPISQPGGPPMSQPGGPPMSQPGGPPMSQPGGPPISQPGGPPMSQPGGMQTGPPAVRGTLPMSHGGPPASQHGQPPMSQTGSALQTGGTSLPSLQQMDRSPGAPYSGGPPGVPTSMYNGTSAGMPPVSQYGAHPNQPGMPGQQMNGTPMPNAMRGPSPGGYMPQHPGAPGMPGQQFTGQPGMSGMPGQQFPGAAAPQPAAPRRLDPDQMPSPIQVIMDDMKAKGGIFQTGVRGIVPPLVTTEFSCQDQGNCNPRFLRSTMYNVPVNNDMMKQCKLPFGLVCSPFAKTLPTEQTPPIVNLGELGPVRCKRCRAYMCPHMQFVDGGRRFNCPFCQCNTDVPQEYFAHLDHTGRRVDTYDRPELCLGSYEFVGTKDYCKNNVLPNPPAFIFMIDVSYNSVKSGLLQLLCQHLMNDILPNLPKETGASESEIRVGFVTYSNVLHFYNVKGNLVQPQMMVVGDVEDVFVPMADGFLVKPSEAHSVIESLLEQLPGMFAESRDTDVVLGPIVQAGMDALKSAGCPGKLFIFHSSLPGAEAPGKLKNRDDRKLLGTEKEKTLLQPQVPFYTTLGQECVAIGCGVDLFLFPNSYIDVATISEVPKLSGGDLYKYDYFQADTQGSRFINALRNAVSKPIAFDVIVRVRTSTGIRPVDFLGNFYMSNTTDVEVGVLDCDKAFCVEIKHDDKLNESDGAYVQVAMLFTSMSGQRRLRIHNLSLNVCAQMADLFKNCELDALINFIAKQAVRNTLLKTPKDVREIIMTQCAEILACYRKNCASPSSAGQLILPEGLKLLPLYTNCIIKSDALQGGSEVSTDSRSYLMHLVNGMDVSSSVPFFYPRLLPLHNMDPDTTCLPIPIRCSAERLSDGGAYLLENGLSMFIWLGHNLNQKFIQDVFGVSSLAQVDIENCIMAELDNPMSKRVMSVIGMIRQQRSHYMKLSVVIAKHPLAMGFKHLLVEDGDNVNSSYVDFMKVTHGMIHKMN